LYRQNDLFFSKKTTKVSIISKKQPYSAKISFKELKLKRERSFVIENEKLFQF